MDTTDAGIDVAHNASAGDKVNSNTIIDLDFSFNIQEYFSSNPILAKNYSLIFNVEFQKLYEFAIGTNSISLDLKAKIQWSLVIKMSVIAKYCSLRYKICILTLTKQLNKLYWLYR